MVWQNKKRILMSCRRYTLYLHLLAVNFLVKNNAIMNLFFEVSKVLYLGGITSFNNGSLLG